MWCLLLLFHHKVISSVLPTPPQITMLLKCLVKLFIILTYLYIPAGEVLFLPLWIKDRNILIIYKGLIIMLPLEFQASNSWVHIHIYTKIFIKGLQTIYNFMSIIRIHIWTFHTFSRSVSKSHIQRCSTELKVWLLRLLFSNI